MSDRDVITSMPRVGALLGAKLGFALSLTYTCMFSALLALALFYRTRFDPLLVSPPLTVLFFACVWFVGIPPAVLLGALTGWCIGLLLKRKGALARPLAAGLVVCIVFATLINIPFWVRVLVDYSLFDVLASHVLRLRATSDVVYASNQAILDALRLNLFLVGVPSVAYVLAGAKMAGQWLPRHMVQEQRLWDHSFLWWCALVFVVLMVGAGLGAYEVGGISLSYPYPGHLAVNSAGASLVSSGLREMRCWDIINGRLRQRWKREDAEISGLVALTPDGYVVTTVKGNDAVQFWRLSNGELVRTQGLEFPEKYVYRAMGLSPGGRYLATGGSGEGVIWLWETATGDALGHIDADGYVWPIGFSPDERMLAAVVRDGIRIWSIPEGNLVQELQGIGYPSVLAWSSDGEILVGGGDGGSVTVWRVHDGTTFRELPGHNAGVHSLAVSPDGKFVASGSGETASDRNGWRQDLTIRVWRVEDGDEVSVLEGHRGVIDNLAFTPDGQTLISMSYDSTVRLWFASW